MKFTKMQGLGNDYVYVNCFSETVENPEELAKKISDRHFGIGSDGLILIEPSSAADFKMEMFNADGSEGQMCGNGIRCVGKYVYEHHLTKKKDLTVETASGIRSLALTVSGGTVKSVCADMGSPVLAAGEIPVSAADPDSPLIGVPLAVGEETYRITCVSMGNPHCVVRVEDPDALDLSAVGPQFENHALFPERVNTEFISIPDKKTIRMRVWERGSGETLSCGTGACAAAVAAYLNGWTEKAVTVRLKGGDLRIRYDTEENRVFMTGPAVTVFEGDYKENQDVYDQ